MMFNNDFIDEIRSMTPTERQEAIEHHEALMAEISDLISDNAMLAAQAMHRSIDSLDLRSWESVREWKQKYLYIPKLIERLMGMQQLVTELQWCQEDLGEINGMKYGDDWAAMTISDPVDEEDEHGAFLEANRETLKATLKDASPEALKALREKLGGSDKLLREKLGLTEKKSSTGVTEKLLSERLSKAAKKISNQKKRGLLTDEEADKETRLVQEAEETAAP